MFSPRVPRSTDGAPVTERLSRAAASALTRRAGLLAGVGGLAGALGACSNVGFGPSASSEPPAAAPTSPVQSGPLPAAAGQTFGTGPVRVGLILPLTGPTGPTVVGQSLRNAAELAGGMSADVTFLVKDDQSTPAGAAAAAQAALSEGAEMILGPLFAANVREAARVVRAANKPVIAFSTDASVAARGVYLLSFLVESYVRRVVDFAVSRGKKSFAALAPEGDYGSAALAEFQSYAAARGVRVMAVERYAGASLAAAAQKIGALGGQIDALFVPETAEGMAAAAQALSAARIDPTRVQLLGTGLWNDARVMKLPGLQGAWFSTPENAGFAAFAQRYRAKYSSDPIRIATLAYDAASLVAALARVQGAQRFSEATLTAPTGFQGADGVFRFRADGLNERGLAVMQISAGQASVIAPAPRSFQGA
jgi:hypothetical protein